MQFSIADDRNDLARIPDVLQRVRPLPGRLIRPLEKWGESETGETSSDPAEEETRASQPDVITALSQEDPF